MQEIIKPSRRGFITGLISFVAAPAVIRTIDLMPVKATIEPMKSGLIVNIVNAGTGYHEAARRIFIPELYTDVWAQYPSTRGLIGR